MFSISEQDDETPEKVKETTSAPECPESPKSPNDETPEKVKETTSAPECPESSKSPNVRTIRVRPLDCDCKEFCSLNH